MKSVALVATSALTIGLLVASPAQAVSSDRVSAGDTAAALRGVDDRLLSVPATKAGVGTVAVGEARVQIPSDLARGVTFQVDGADVRVKLPRARDAESAVALADGTVTYPSDRSSNSIIASDDGVQMLTTIAGSTSPTRYEYRIDLPQGGTLKEVDGGSIAVLDDLGNPVLTILPAWARDASGVAVPTHYGIEGATLVQHVDHASGKYSYPIVADPKFAWMGVLPTVKLTRAETYKMAYASTPAKLSLCVAIGGVAGVALAVPCALGAAILAAKSATIYRGGKCVQVLIGPGILGAVDYKDSYCK